MEMIIIEDQWSPDSGSFYLLVEIEGRYLPCHLVHPGRRPKPLYLDRMTHSIDPLTTTSLLLSISSLNCPMNAFILDLTNTEAATGDENELSPRRMHMITDWSSKHIAGRINEMRPEKFWFEGDEGWRVMGWAVKPKGWKESDAERGKVWPMGMFRTRECLVTIYIYSLFHSVGLRSPLIQNY